ncbi:MAG: choice-of-anchor D domain-containing protein [Alphaproteobacteria bacterium]|nr:choice-of-anchor D domain-containing protein [Alphaproteobacteria bacterium]
MKRALLLLALVACKQDVTLQQVEARLVVPTPLVDVSAQVGETVPFVVRLEHSRGEAVEVVGIDVVAVQGTGFTYTGETGQTLAQNEVLELPFAYAPDDSGFDVAALYIRTNAVDGTFQITARGRAALPQVEAFPAAADFGPVAVGETKSVQVRLDNDGDEPVAIGAVTTDTRFTVIGTLPVTVPDGGFVTLPVSYAPIDAGAVTAVLTLSVGDQDFASVSLRANDCANGTPALYDADGDGVSGCAGDCDDADPDVRPGAAEVVNGADDDCDGDIDEGSAGTDDDGDGYCEGTTCTDGSTPGDCNDARAASNPGATEVNGNGYDDDCDGAVDAGSVDLDGDGTAPPLDCNDSAANVFPGAPEIVDGLDNDCDNAIDEGTTAGDDDGDGYCEGTVCTGALMPGDCDDTDALTYPGAAELPDWVDNDCDGDIDEGTVNEDGDGDGFTTAGGDCDDTDDTVNPARGNCP